MLATPEQIASTIVGRYDLYETVDKSSIPSNLKIPEQWMTELKNTVEQLRNNGSADITDIVLADHYLTLMGLSYDQYADYLEKHNVL